MDAVMASIFSSSLSLSLSHPSRGFVRRGYVCENLFISSNTRRHILQRDAQLGTTSLPLEWSVMNAGCRKNAFLASATNSETSAQRRGGRKASDGLVHSDGTANNGSVVVDDANNSIIAEQPKRKRGRPKKVATTTTTIIEEPAKSQDGPKTSEEEEFDFFKELAKNMKKDSSNAKDSGAMEAPGVDDDDKRLMNEPNVVEKIGDDETEWRAVSTGADTVIWPQGKVIKGVKETVKGDGWVIELENRKQLLDNTGDEETEITTNSTDRPKSNLGQTHFGMPRDTKMSLALNERHEIGQEVNSVLNEDKEKEKEEEEEEEVEEQPLWVDEEDPTWPEEGEDGWGFRTSQFFDKMSLKTETKKTGDENEDDDDDDDDDELVTNWESEADDWVIKEIVSNDWEANVFADPSPLVVYVFARYGCSGMDGWKALKELETAVVSIWESCKAPLRAVKVDIGMEVDLGAALNIGQDDCPQFIFIKNGKSLHKLEGFRTSEELLQYIAHFFYNGKRPSSLQILSSSESLKSIA